MIFGCLVQSIHQILFLKFLNKILFKIISPLLKYLDIKTKYLEKQITSGWFLIVKKNKVNLYFSINKIKISKVEVLIF